MSRIKDCFRRLSNRHRKALLPYVTAGDPQPGVTVEPARPDYRALLAVCLLQVLLWLLLGQGVQALVRRVAKLWVFILFITLAYALTAQDPATDQWVRLPALFFTIPINLEGVKLGLAGPGEVRKADLTRRQARRKRWIEPKGPGNSKLATGSERSSGERIGTPDPMRPSRRTRRGRGSWPRPGRIGREG